MNILTEIEKYKKVFDISIPIRYQEDSKEQWLLFGEDQSVLSLNGNLSLPVIPQFMAQIKMGLLYHPLLATFYFQKNLSNKESLYARMFHELAEPLIDVWTVQTQSRYMGESAFAKELDLIDMMNDMILSGKLNDVRTYEILSVYLLNKTFVNANVKLETAVKTGTNQVLFDEYVNFLESAAKREPNIDDILQLPVITNAPFIVKIKSKPYIYLEIKEK